MEIKDNKICKINGKELKAYNHIIYEIEMFKKIALICKKLNQYDLSEVLRFLLVDSFAIHLRNLIYFLTKDNRNDDDIVVKEFIDNKLDIPPRISAKFEEYKIKSNKLCAHLTFKRIEYFETETGKTWDVSNIYNEVIEIFNQFVDEFNSKSKFRDVITFEKLPEFKDLEDENISNLLIFNPKDSADNIINCPGIAATLSSEYPLTKDIKVYPFNNYNSNKNNDS